MDCPVCRNAATNMTPIGYRGLVVKCRRCGSYCIAESAFAAFLKLKTEGRVKALERARELAARKVWPTIDKTCL
jgi:hypothetical protein